MATVLIVDDNPENRLLLVKLLGAQGHDLVEAVDGCQGLDAARKLAAAGRLDLVLLDLAMPVLDGYGFLAEQFSDPALCEVPTIVVTASPKDTVRVIEAGAHDYVVKPFDLGELLVRVRAALRVKDLQDRLRAQNVDLGRLCTIDCLTDLTNRRGAERQLKKMVDAARRHGHHMAVLIVDADHFKQVNDRHGHIGGDHVLIELGRRLQASVRSEDIAARWGGDEFLIALPITDGQRAAVLAEQLRTLVATTPITLPDGSPVTVTVSIGAAAGGPDVESLVRRADEALYAAKHAGRNTVRVGAESRIPSCLWGPCS